MASFALNELFLRARDQFVASGRATALVVTALLVAHGALLAPAVEEERARRDREREARRLDEVAPQVAEVGATVATAGREAMAQLDPALERFADGLEDDLDRLAAAVVALRREAATTDGTGDADAGDEADDADDPAPAATAADRVELQAPDRQVVPLAIDDAERRYDLAAAAGREELLAALAPVVDALVVRPRFEALASTWRQDALPRLATRVDAAAGRLPRLRSRLGVADDEIAALAESLTGLRRTARELAPRPPEEPYWWATSGDGGALRLAPAEATALRLREPLFRDELAAAIATVAERQAAVEERLAAARDAAVRDAAADGAGGARDDDPVLGAPVRGTGAAGLAAVAPLLLAVVLAALAAWRTSRLRELGLTVALAHREGAPPSLRAWFLGQAGAVGDADDLTAAAARGRWRRATLLWLAGALAWVALAVLQAWLLGDGDATRTAAVAALAAGVLLVAAGHRLHVAGRTLALLPDPAAAAPSSPAPAPPAAADADVDADPLDVKTLQR